MSNEEKENLFNLVMENLHRSALSVPVISNYVVQEDPGDAIVVAKSPDGSVEQFLEDGYLEEGETFDQRLEKVIAETQQSMTENGLDDVPLQYLGNQKNDLFDFHIFLQDNIKDGVQVRQINAYFLEPENNCFYEVCLAAPPIYASDVNNFVTENIYVKLISILANISYNEKNPIK